MSKDTPEVGDLWIDLETDRIHHITFIENDLIWFTVATENSGIGVFWQFCDNFRKECKYLGKSKVNIKELFNVAED